MTSIHKLVSVLACGVVLGVGLPSNAVTAADRLQAGQSHEGLGGQPAMETEAGQLKGAVVERGKTVPGESLYLKGTDYDVKGQDSKEVGLHIHPADRKYPAERSDGERGRSDAK